MHYFNDDIVSACIYVPTSHAHMLFQVIQILSYQIMSYF